MKRPELLDLFCGAGGAGMGYRRAGFRVTGSDIAPHVYPAGRFVLADAMAVLRSPWYLDTFAAVHTSPPCQASTTMSNRWRGKGGKADDHINLIPDVRELLEEWGGPWVIENVAGAKSSMRGPVTLSGGMFGLGVDRPRLFESNVPLTALPRRRVDNPLGVYGKAHDGRRLFTRKDGSIQRAAKTLEEGGAAMGIDWMSWEDLTESIPPAYTEHIGRQLLGHIASEVAA